MTMFAGYVLTNTFAVRSLTLARPSPRAYRKDA